MPIFDSPVEKQKDYNIASVVPPDLLEAAKSGNEDYFLAMLDLCGDESMMSDLFIFLLHQEKRFCSLLLKEGKISDENLQKIFSRVNREEKSLIHHIIHNTETAKK